ncbi:monodechloroaminopyrrolnitrin synthase PrnB family protein [Streptomyces tritici]|uniref:monodechloroaminopyrrolnitrin synthase PrnB family protein n=1 Tax=Streptomyces tritici TaxID=2054410 RepID=UPI003AF0A206
MNSIQSVDAFDQWLRTDFVALNTRLEEGYTERTPTAPAAAAADGLAQRLAREGAELIGRIADAGRAVLAADDADRYELLGSLGMYLAACRRHETDGPPAPRSTHGAHGPQSAAWPLATALGTSLGVAPRFVFAHQAQYNRAAGDRLRTFTSLDDEHTFIVHNALSALAYRRTATALGGIRTLGPSNPMTEYLLREALAGLDDAMDFGTTLSKNLDVDRFFLHIRPYFKSYRVGAAEYRGANAGDFAAINAIDLLLGLCSAHDPFYQAVLAEKQPYLPPEDRPALRAAVRAEPLLDVFLREADERPVTPRLRENVRLLLALCVRHGAVSSFHHHRLVVPFLQKPASMHPEPEDLTSSGPPLDVVVAQLARLVDLRTARRRAGAFGARDRLDRLRDAAGL